MPRTSYVGPLYLILATTIWGSMYVVSKVVLGVVPPVLLVWWRYVVALIALAVMGVLTRQSWRIDRSHVKSIVAVGLIGYVISIAAQFYGTALSTAQWGSVITATTPAFMIVFAAPLLGERVTFRKAGAVILAILGTAVMIGVGTVSSRYEWGGLALVLAALAWALMSVLVKKAPTSLPLWTLTFYAMSLALFVLTPMSLATMPSVPWAQLTRPLIAGGIVYLGVVATAGAFYFWNRGLQLTEAGSGGIYFVFQPLSGTLLSYLLLKEPIGPGFLAGALLIGAAVWLISRGRVAPIDVPG